MAFPSRSNSVPDQATVQAVARKARFELPECTTRRRPWNSGSNASTSSSSSTSSSLRQSKQSRKPKVQPPKLTIFHETNEMVLRDCSTQIMALIVAGTATSSSGVQSTFKAFPARFIPSNNNNNNCKPSEYYTIYGCTPMSSSSSMDNNNAQQVHEVISSTVMQSIKQDMSRTTKVYEWATITGKRSGSLLSFGGGSNNNRDRKMELRLRLALENSTSSTNCGTYSMKSVHACSRIETFFRNQLEQHVPYTKMVLTNDEVMIHSTVDPKQCVFVLAHAPEVMSYVLLTMNGVSN